MTNARKSTLRSVRMYRRRREALIDRLGGGCSECGSGKKLEFHHTDRKDWTPNKLSRWTRIVLYERDAGLGVLLVLCRSCHLKLHYGG